MAAELLLALGAIALVANALSALPEAVQVWCSCLP